VLQHGGGGEESRYLCGFMHSDHRFGPLIDAMPSLTCVRVRDGASVLEAYTDSGRCADPVLRHASPASTM
jgi:AraC family transcriptional regulator, alkane utilization regulator